MYSEQEFEQAIDALMNFSTKLRATTEIMRSRAETCVVNMGEDTVAQGASSSLISVLDRIQDILDTQLQSLLNGLEQDKERAAQIAQSDE